MLPCGSCPYYCNVTGNPSTLCVRCNKPARAHGDLVDTGEIERRWALFSTIVARYDEQNTKDKELTTRMINEMLSPVAPDPPLNPTPPFEDVVIDEIILNIVREQQMRADASERDPVRQAGGLLSRLLSATVFFRAVLEAQRLRPSSDPQLLPMLDLWRRQCHQCRLPTPEEPARTQMCEYCTADFDAGTRVTTAFPPLTKCFGLKFLRIFWDNIKHVAINVKEQGMPAGAKARLESIVRDLEVEVRLGSSSMVFRKYSQVRLGVMQALRQRDLHAKAQQQAPPPPPPALPVAPSMAPPPVMPKLVRAPSVNDQLAQLATPPMPKKIKAEDDGKPDSFLVKVVNDTKSPAGWELLIGLKEVISKQLPEMPKYYIMRALFDGHHESLCVLKNGKVVGGCTFRPFVKQGFVEVVFLVVNPNTTNKGLGSLIMTEVKTFVHSAMRVDFLLTYADNTAIDFFKKQGFSKDITLARTRWAGFIKDYTKATLMEYHIAPARDAAIAQQAQWVKNCINATMDTTEVHKGFSDKTHKVAGIANCSAFYLTVCSSPRSSR